MTILVRAVAFVVALIAGAAIGAIAEAVIAGHDERSNLAPGHRRALDEDWWTG